MIDVRVDPTVTRGMVAVRALGWLSIERVPKRDRCALCHRRRELYYLVIRTDYTNQTEARCWSCWGMR